MSSNGGRESTLNAGIMAAAFAAVIALVPFSLRANDWPCWGGPNRDFHTDEKITIWPTNGVWRELWRADVGRGFSQVIVSQGKVYTYGWLGNPAQPGTGMNMLQCFDEASTGTNPIPMWTTNYVGGAGNHGASQYVGTWNTPAVSGGKVYTYDYSGRVICYDAANGAIQWTSTPFGGGGGASSPLIEGDLLIVDAGSLSGAAAISVTTNHDVLQWGSTGGTSKYTSPKAVTIGGQRTIIGCGGYDASQVAGMDLNGNLLWNFNFGVMGMDLGGPIGSPQLVGTNQLFISQEKNCWLVPLGGSGSLSSSWSSSSALGERENTPAIYSNCVFGIDYMSGRFRCLDLSSGTVRWEQTGFAAESAQMSAGDQILVMTGAANGPEQSGYVYEGGNGALLVVQASTTYTQLCRVDQILTGYTWTPPTICNGKMYLRSLNGTMICYEVGTPPPSAGNSGYKMQILFSGYSADGTMTNFPALVVLSNNVNNSAFAFSQMVSPSDGADLRFYSADTVTELKYEIDTWNTNGSSYIWVQVPTIASSNDFIWAYWGDPNNATKPAYTTNGGAWDSTFGGVWHMNEVIASGGTQHDSTSNHNDAVYTGGGASACGTACVIGGGDKINGMGPGLVVADSPSLEGLNHCSVSLWLRSDAGDGLYHVSQIMSKTGQLNMSSHAGITAELLWVTYGTGRHGVYMYPGNPDAWNYVVGTWDSASVNNYFYCNGTQRDHRTGTECPTITGVDSPFVWGMDSGVPSIYSADECRYENVPRSSNWVWSCYMTMASNSSFQTYGGMSSVSPTTGIVQFASSAYSVPEDGGSVTVKVFRLNGASGAAVVGFSTSDGTGHAGSNYTATNGTLAFANGETSKTFTVFVNDDHVWEPGNLTVNLGLSLNGGALMFGDPSSAVLTIIDVDGPGSLQFSGSGYAVSQDAGTMSITVTRANGTTGPASVDYLTSDGTAQNGVNYTTTSGTLNFADGETSKTFSVTILNSPVGGAGKTVNLTLLNPQHGATVGTPGTAVLTIVPPGPFSTWSHCMKIQFPGYTKAEALTNFPVSLVFSNNMGGGFSYGQFTSASGGDLRFSDGAKSNALNFEVEKWVTNDASYVWVQVPVLTTNCAIWAYWGNSNTNLPVYATNGATWSSSFSGVWHLGEISGTAKHFDSTANGNNATTNGTTSMGATGVVDGAAVYTGGDYGRITNVNNSLTITGKVITVGIWVQPTANMNQAAKVGFLGKLQESGGGSADYGLFYDWTTVHFAGGGADVSAGYDPPLYIWTYMVGVCDGSYLRFYVNGVQWSSTACSGNTPNTSGFPVLLAGGHWGGKFNGKLDEGRIMTAAASSNWVWASYVNMASNSTFCCYTNNASGNAAMGTPISWLVNHGLSGDYNWQELQDPDGDHVPTWQEYIMGTDPTSASGVLKATIQSRPGGGVTVFFSSLSASGSDYAGKQRFYTLESTTNLVPPSWQAILNYSNMPVIVDGPVTYTNATITLKSLFYRVRTYLQ